MLFTPWLSSVRGRLQFAKRFRKSRRALKTTSQPPVELLEDRTLLSSPTLVNVRVNVGDFIADGDVRDESPSALTFKFSPGQVIDPATLDDGIHITRSGYDRASVTSDFNTTGAVTVEFTAVSMGTAGNGITVDVTESDHGDASGPTVTVVGKAITIDLNSANPSTAQILVDTIKANPDAAALVVASIPTGDPATVVAPPVSSPLVLSGASAVAISPGYVGVNPDAQNEVIVRFAEALPDDTYRIEIVGSGSTPLTNSLGEAFNDGVDLLRDFELDLGAQVIAVVPQPVDRDSSSGALLSRRDQIDVYFNNDDLFDTDDAGDPDYARRAENPSFYQLILTNDTVTNTDDTVFLPVSVDYDAARDMATLTFASDIEQLAGPGTYRLRVGTSETTPMQPIETDLTAADTGSSFDTADTTFGVLSDVGNTSRIVSESIDNSGQPFPLQYPGSLWEPGHRLIEPQNHYLGILLQQLPVTDSVVGMTSPQYYNFQSNYGADPYGTQLENVITPEQQERTRDIFEIYGEYLGMDFVESDNLGWTIVTGDLRALDPTVSTGRGGVLGIAGGGMAIMDNAELWDDSYGFPDDPQKVSWFWVAMHEIGHLVGLGHSDELPPTNIMDGAGYGESTLSFNQIEPVFPGDAAIYNGQYLHRPESKDIDLYQFEIAADVTGQFTAEIIAERQPDTSLLDSVLTLYKENAASVSSRFNVADLEIQLSAVDTGPVGNGISVVVTKSNLGPISGPSVSVDLATNTIKVTLNTNPARPSTAGEFVSAIATHSQASTLVVASVVAGDLNADISAGPINYSPLVLLGGDREVLSRNDDYFSEDSYIERELGPGVYYVGVSASGNDVYDPTIPDTGVGGTSEGVYDLRLNFRTNVANSIIDADNRGNTVVSETARTTALDGDADGVAGGAYNFWFRTTAVSGAEGPGEPKTIFVDKAFTGGGNDGSPANPFTDIDDAFAVASSGDIVRIVGNGGVDGDLSTIDDSFPYEIGFDNSIFQVPLDDGPTMDVPQGVSVMVDAGAVFKMRLARIGVGSSTTTVNRSGGTLQVLGTPEHDVVFTSWFDESIGGDTSPDGPTTPASGNWGGLVFQNDVDTSQGRFGWENEGIFLNYVNHADIRYGGGNIDVESITQVVTPIQMVRSRPTVSFNTITQSADAAISADPDSFQETNFHAPRYQFVVPFTSDYDRVGPDVHGNVLLNNSINGMLVRIVTPAGNNTRPLTVPGRFDDIDIVHVIAENLQVQGTAGGPVHEDDPPDATLIKVDAVIGGTGTLAADTYDYKMTFVDTFGYETPPSGATASATLTATGQIELTALPPVPPAIPISEPQHSPNFVGRNLYRSLPAGGYTLVARLDGSATTYMDDGTTIGGTLDDSVTSLLRPRQDARLAIDPGTIVKLEGGRIEVTKGAQLIAEGLEGREILFTSRADDRFGAGGTFDTNNDDSLDTSEVQPASGDWGGIFFGPISTGSIDHALITYAGGINAIKETGGDFAGFNAVEIHQADVRLTNSILEHNAGGTGGTAPADRFGRGFNAQATIFVRGAQPVVVNNIIRNNTGPGININTNALNPDLVVDYGRSTGDVDMFQQFGDNQGPLVRMNRLVNNSVNGLEIRGETLTTQGVWDDTDIVHVVYDQIVIPDFHTYGGLRLESSPTENLVVKLSGRNNAGFTALGRPLDIDDRIGGILQIVGQPGFPVVLTSLSDDSVGAGFDLDGFPQNNTNGGAANETGTPGDWRSIRIDQFAHDRNVEVIVEDESRDEQAPGANAIPNSAQFLGALAAYEKGGDENLRLGFEVHGFLSAPNDVDVYSFEATAGTEVWLDIDRTTHSLDTVIELVTSSGQIIAQSDDSLAEGLGAYSVFETNPLTDANILQRSAYLGVDDWTTNFRDAGMRIVLPGTVGTLSSYHVRVRSSNLDRDPLTARDGTPLQDPTLLLDGLTSGVYEMQVRLHETDELPGSTVRLADIRYATNGVEIYGQPIHSPLLGEVTEDSTVNDDGPNALTDAQPVGNLFNSDRAALTIAGRISTTDDVDFYQFEVRHDVIQGASPEHIPVVFDLDYADGLSRANTVLSVFDSAGRLILTSRDSNIAEDRPAPLEGADIDDLDRGSPGPLDPFIGPIEMPRGTYYLAVSSHEQIPEELDQTLFRNATNPLVRLEPADVLNRIAEDHINFNGGSTMNTPADLFDANSIVPFHLGDVTLFVSRDGGITGTNRSTVYTVDPFTGTRETLLGQFGPYVGDVAMRADGDLFAFSTQPQTGNLDDDNVGNYLRIDTGTAAAANLGDDGVQTFRDNPTQAGFQVQQHDVGMAPEAIAYSGTSQYNGYYVGTRNSSLAASAPVQYVDNVLYRFDINNGRVQNVGGSGQRDREDNARVAGAGTQKREIGQIDTSVGMGGIVTGLAIVGGWGYAVDDAGGLYRVSLWNASTTFIAEIAPTTEVQQLELQGPPTTGVFQLRFQPPTGPAEWTGDINYDATAADIETALLALNSIGTDEIQEVRMAGAPTGGQFTLEFNGDIATIPYDRVFSPNTATATGVRDALRALPSINGDVDYLDVNETLYWADEAQRLTTSGIPAAGSTFTLTFNGATTTDIAFDATAADIDTALEALPTIGAGNVAVTGGPMDLGQVNIRFTNAYAQTDVPAIFVNNALMTGGSVQRTTIEDGVTPVVRIQFTGSLSEENVSQLIPDNTLLVGGTAQVTTLQQGSTDVFVTGGPLPGAPIRLEFGGQYLGLDLQTMWANSGTLDGTAVVTPISDGVAGIDFQGLAVGPNEAEGGRYATTLFGIDRTGTIYAFDTAGVSLPIFVDAQTSVNTGLTNVTGLDFGTLDRNLWHETSNRNGDAGHGLVEGFNGSGASRPTSTAGSSLYFGNERTGAAAGNKNNLQTGRIRDYNFPGGAQGTIVSNPFSLTGYTEGDQPVLYFNYFLDTDDTDYNYGPNPDDLMQDSFRVFIVDESAESDTERGNWSLLGTNNSLQESVRFDEYDIGPFSDTASTAFPTARRQPDVQELFDDTGGWRQARIDLSQYVGSDTLRLRFDFATAGGMDFANVNNQLDVELRAIPAWNLRDGDTFAIDGNDFEFDFGYTLVVPSGPAIADGNIFTLNGTVFEFDNDAFITGDVPVFFTTTDSPTDVAGRIANSIQFNNPGGIIVSQDENRINLIGANSLALGGGFLGIIDGEPGTAGIPVPVNSSMDSTAVANAVAEAMARTFSLIEGVPGTVVDNGWNFAFASAQSLEGEDWNTTLDLNIGDTTTNTSETIPHVSIAGTGDGTFDYYSFTVAAPGTGIFDIDGANFDTELFLYDTAGTLLAENDTSAIADGQGGSFGPQDAFLEYVFGAAGTYFIGVGGFDSADDNGSIVGQAPQAGDVYTLQVSIENHSFGTGAFVPEVSTVKTYQNMVYVIGHTVTDQGPLGYDGQLAGDSFGAFEAGFVNGYANRPGSLRGMANNNEGVYIDDIIIGFAERGEMITNAAANTNFIDNYEVTNPNLPVGQPYLDILTGPYDVEIRRGADYGLSQPGNPQLLLYRGLDANDRVAHQMTLNASGSYDVYDGQTFTLSDGVDTLTFEFDDITLNDGVAPGNVEIDFDPLASRVDSIVNESEPNDNIAGAQDLETADWSRSSDPNIGDTSTNTSTTIPHISIDGSGDGTFDYYSFDVANAGDRGIFDIDGASFDTQLFLFDTAGTMLTQDDDSSTTEGAGGSTSGLDSFIEYTFPAAGTYVVAVGQFFSWSDGFGNLTGSAPQPGESYTLHVTVENHAEIPPTLTAAHTVTELAASIRDLINSTSVQAVLEITAAMADGTVTGAATDNRINLFGNVVGSIANPLDFGSLSSDVTAHGMEWGQVIHDYTTDQNQFRDQGQILIQANIVTDSMGYGIAADAGQRDRSDLVPRAGDLPHSGPTRNTQELNSDRLAVGPVIMNNVIARSGSGGILFSGDPTNAATEQWASTPYGRIVNNTIVGGPGIGGTGIEVTEYASPTILNNIVADLNTGISVDATSRNLNPVIGGTLYQNNASNTNLPGNQLGAFPIVLSPTDPLFVDASVGNYYLAPGSQAIDSALDSLGDRASLITVKTPLGIPVSPILAPETDVTGLLRGDDPKIPTPGGQGGQVFFDRGAIDRVDFYEPNAFLIVPKDNGTADLDPTVSEVFIDAPKLFTDIVLEFTDEGIGLDEPFVTSQFVLVQQTADNKDGRVLVDGTDYLFRYNTNTNRASFTAGQGLWDANSRYFIYVDNTPDGVRFEPFGLSPGPLNGGIRDLAGNLLAGNQTDGSSLFTILVTSGANEAPVHTLPAVQTINEDTSATFSTTNGFELAVNDADAFLADDHVEVTLVATNGLLSLARMSAVSDFATGGAVQITLTAREYNQSLITIEVAKVNRGDGDPAPTITVTGGNLIHIDLNSELAAPTTAQDLIDAINSHAQASLIILAEITGGTAADPAAQDLTIPVISYSPLTITSPVFTFTGGNGTDDLSMTFNGDIDDINVALDGLVFTPTPDFNDDFGTASFTITTDDLGNFSAGSPPAMVTGPDTITILVNPVNDAPALAPTATFTLDDIDEDDTTNGGTLVSTIIASSATNAPAVPDAITDADLAAPTFLPVEGVAVTGVTEAHGTWKYSIWDGTTSTFGAWTAFGAVSDAAAVLVGEDDKIRYEPATDFRTNTVDTDDTITFRAWDQSSGAAGATVDTSDPNNGGITAFSTDLGTATITVNAINDAPVVFLPDGDMSLTGIDEDNANGTNVPTAVKDIIDSSAANSSDAITDVDANPDGPYAPEDAQEGIAVVGVDDTNGRWEYSIDGGGSWRAFAADGVPNDGVTLDSTQSVLLDGDDLIQFLPAQHFNGAVSPGITFRAWDQSAGSSGNTGIDTSANGGTTAFSSDTETASITVAPINDAPVGVDDVYTMLENGTLNVTDPLGLVTPAVPEDDGVLDNDVDVDNDPLVAILKSLPTNGTLKRLDGSLLAVDDSFDGTFIFEHDGSSLPLSVSFTYVPNDGTVDGNLTTVTINITPVNDAPIAVDREYWVAENNAQNPLVLLNANDVNGAGTPGVPGDDGLLAPATSDEEAHALRAVLVSGDNPSLSLQPDGTFIYTHDGSDVTEVVFQYLAKETATTELLESNTATVTIHILPENDSPEIAGTQTVAITDIETALPFSGVIISDPDLDPATGQPADTLSVTVTLLNGTATGPATDDNGGFTTDSLNDAGFTKTGTGEYTLSTPGSAANVTAAIRQLVFQPTENQVGLGGVVHTWVDIAVNDNAGGTDTDNTTHISTTSVNAPPAITGTVAGQPVNDDATILPFNAPGAAGGPVTITDTDSTDLVVTVNLRDGANASTDQNGWFTSASLSAAGFAKATETNPAADPGLYVFLGYPGNGDGRSPADAGAALQLLEFQPQPNQVAPGLTVTTTFVIFVDDDVDDALDNNDGLGPVSDGVTTVIATSIDDMPVIVGEENRTGFDNASLTPFPNVTIVEPDLNPDPAHLTEPQPVTVTLAQDTTAYGTLSNLGLFSFNAVSGLYEFTGTAADATASLRGMQFDPAENTWAPTTDTTTAFTLTVDDDGVGTTDTANVSVTITSVNDDPTIDVPPANQAQTVLDTGTISPFAVIPGVTSGVAIDDVDNPDQDLQVTITLEDSLGTATDANGQFTTVSLAAAGFQKDAAAGVYTLVTPADAAAVTTALGQLVFQPTENQVAPGNSVFTTFVIGVTDETAGTANNVQTVIEATPFNVLPVIAGTAASQTNDKTRIKPFFNANAAVTVTDTYFPEGGSLTLTVTLLDELGTPTDANGVLTAESLALAGFTRAGTGTYRTAGVVSDTEATRLLRLLNFQPVQNLVTPGDIVITRFVITVDDGGEGGPSTDNVTTVGAVSVNDIPIIAGAGVNHSINDKSTVIPFGTVTYIDDPGQTIAVTITLRDATTGFATDANGGFTPASLAKTGFLKQASVQGTYTLAATTTVEARNRTRQLVFQPTENQAIPPGSVTTRFTIDIDGGPANGTATDSTTTVQAISVNDAPSVSGALPNQAVNDKSTIKPFRTIVVSDPDASQPLTVTVKLDDAAKGTFTALSLADSGFVGIGGGKYSFVGTAAQSQTAIRKLDFDPTENLKRTGLVTTVWFDISVKDASNSSATDSNTSVNVTSVGDPPLGVNDPYTLTENGILRAIDADGSNLIVQNGVLANDVDVDGDPMTASLITPPTYHVGVFTLNVDGTFTYRHDGSEEASDSFTYRVTDDQGQWSTATATITIVNVNDSPIANDDWYIANSNPSTDSLKTSKKNATNIDTSLLLQNDTDPDPGQGESLTLASINSSATKGVVTRQGDTITYDPNGKFNALSEGQVATDTFVYTVRDVNGATNMAMVTITITGTNDAPQAVDDRFQVQRDQILNGSADVLAANPLTPDSDLDGDPLTVSAVNGVAGNVGSTFTLPSGARLTLNSNGLFVYDPNGQFDHLGHGDQQTDTFYYTITDGKGLTDTATVTVTLTGPNTAPTIDPTQGFAFLIPEHSANGSVVTTVVADDVETPAGGLSFAITSGNTNGAFSIDNNGVIRVANSSALDFESNSSFTLGVRVTDSGSPTLSDTATFTVNLTDVVETLVVDPGAWTTGGVTLVRDGLWLRVLTTGTNTDAVPRHRFSSVTGLTITGRDGASDTFTIDFGAGNPIPAGGLHYEGGSGAGIDTLVLQNSGVTTFATVDHLFLNASSGTVTVDGDQITYTGLEPVIDDLVATDRTFTFGDSDDIVTLSGTATVSEISSVSSSETVRFTNPTGTLTVETAGGNDVIDVSAIVIDVNLSGGAGADRLVAQADADMTLSMIVDGSRLTIDGIAAHSASGIEHVQLTGGASDNVLDASAFNYSYVNATGATVLGTVQLNGGAGNDTLEGGYGEDSLFGEDGDDHLEGNLGSDTVMGGAGLDSLYGGAGGDLLDGGDGDDSLLGQGSSHDTLIGGPGDDILDGGTGNADFVDATTDGDITVVDGQLTAVGLGTDTLVNIERARLTGGDSNNTLDATGFSGIAYLIGGPGEDTLLGGAGNDRLYGQLGDDSLVGGAGRDFLYGGGGKDYLDGGLGDDAANGQSGSNDTIVASGGNDTLRGGSGNDTLFVTGDGNFNLSAKYLTGPGIELAIVRTMETAVINGGDGDDTIDARDFIGQVSLNGGGGNDVLIGGVRNDELNGGDGNDTLVGGGGSDSLIGGAGNDVIAGYAGQDTIIGDDGDDTLVGGTDDDSLVGGAGDDLIAGEEGNDTLTGNEGADTLSGGPDVDTITDPGDPADTIADVFVNLDDLLAALP